MEQYIMYLNTQNIITYQILLVMKGIKINKNKRSDGKSCLETTKGWRGCEAGGD